MYQLSFYVPETHLDTVKTALFAVGAGKIGAYDCCAWQTKGEGQFRPLNGSRPFLGKENQLEQVVEYKIEMVCAAKNLQAAISALKKSHPYEEPAYAIIELIYSGPEYSPPGE